MRVWWILGLLLWAVPAVGRAALFDLDLVLRTTAPAPSIGARAAGAEIDIHVVFDDSVVSASERPSFSIRRASAFSRGADLNLRFGDVDRSIDRTAVMITNDNFVFTVPEISEDFDIVFPDGIRLSLSFDSPGRTGTILGLNLVDLTGRVVVSDLPPVFDAKLFEELFVGQSTLLRVREPEEVGGTLIEVRIEAASLVRREVPEPRVLWLGTMIAFSMCVLGTRWRSG